MGRRVSPPGATESALLLARASTEHQATRVGDQTGGRVFLFLNTDDFGRDFNAYKSEGVKVIREPKTEDYGTVAVFHDLHGNQWDLVALSHDRRDARSRWWQVQPKTRPIQLLVFYRNARTDRRLFGHLRTLDGSTWVCERANYQAQSPKPKA
jgi:hypothetical protein